MVVDNDGNIYAAGLDHVAEQGDMGLIIKIDSSGSLVWDRFISEGDDVNSDIDLFQIGMDGNGDIYVGGSRIFNGIIYLLTAKYDQNGNQEWLQNFSYFKLSNDFNGMFVNSSGDIFVTGWTGSSNIDFITVKYNSLGEQQWFTTYDGSSNLNDFSSSVISDDSGNVYITGSSIESGATSLSVIKYNSVGEEQWVSIYPAWAPNIYSTGKSITLDNASNLYINGYAYTSSNHSGIQKTLKYSPGGSLVWDATYDSDGDDGHWNWSNPILVDNSGNVFVTFESEKCSTCSDKDAVTIKYSQNDDNSVIISQKLGLLPERYDLGQNYPNPFNPSTVIKFTLPESENVKLVVFDILGREVKTLVNEVRSSGIYEVSFDASELSSGIYFYRLVTDNFTDTKRLLLIK